MCGLFFIALMVEYVKQYSRDRRTEERERGELERAYLLSQSTILPHSVTSKGAVIFAAYRKSPAFLSGSAVSCKRRNPYILPPSSLNCYSLHHAPSEDVRDYDWLEPPNATFLEQTNAESEYEDDEEENACNYTTPKSRHESLQSTTYALSEMIKLKHGIKIWSSDNELEESVLENSNKSKGMSNELNVIFPKRDSVEFNLGFPLQRDQSDRPYTISFPRRFITDMITNYPFIVPLLREMFIKSQNNEAREQATPSDDDRLDKRVPQVLPIITAEPIKNEDKPTTEGASIHTEDSETRIRKNYMNFLKTKKMNTENLSDELDKKPLFSNSDRSEHLMGPVFKKVSSLVKIEQEDTNAVYLGLGNTRRESSSSTTTHKPNSPRTNLNKLNTLKENAPKLDSPASYKQSFDMLSSANSQKSNQNPDIISSKKKGHQNGIKSELVKQAVNSRAQAVEKVRLQLKTETKSGFMTEAGKRKTLTLATRKKITLENLKSLKDTDDDLFQPQALNNIIYNFSTPFESQKTSIKAPRIYPILSKCDIDSSLIKYETIKSNGKKAPLLIKHEMYKPVRKESTKLIENKVIQLVEEERIPPPKAHSHHRIDQILIDSLKAPVQFDMGTAGRNDFTVQEGSPLRGSRFHPSPALELKSLQNKRHLVERDFSPIDLSKPRGAKEEDLSMIAKTDSENKTKKSTCLIVNEIDLERAIECDKDVSLENVIKKQQKLMSVVMKKKQPRKEKPRFVTTANREASWNKTVTRLRNATMVKMNRISNESSPDLVIGPSWNPKQNNGTRKTGQKESIPIQKLSSSSFSASLKSTAKHKTQNQKNQLLVTDQYKKSTESCLVQADANILTLNIKRPSSFQRQLTKPIIVDSLDNEPRVKTLSPSAQKARRKLMRPDKIKKLNTIALMHSVIYDSHMEGAQQHFDSRVDGAQQHFDSQVGGAQQHFDSQVEGAQQQASESNSITYLSEEATETTDETVSGKATVIEKREAVKHSEINSLQNMSPPKNAKPVLVVVPPKRIEISNVVSRPNENEKLTKSFAKLRGSKSSFSTSDSRAPSRSINDSPIRFKGGGFKLKNNNENGSKTKKQNNEPPSKQSDKRKNKHFYGKTVEPETCGALSEKCRVSKELSCESLYTSDSEVGRSMGEIDVNGLVENRYILKKSVLDEVVQQLRLGSITSSNNK